MDFVSRFTERIGSRTGREVARKKKKERKERKKRGKRRGGRREKREERARREKRPRGRGENMDISVSLFIAVGYLITMTGGERALAGLSRARLCEKFAQDEDEDEGRRWWRGFPYSPRGSSDAMIYHHLPVRAARRNYSFSETWTDDTFTSSSISNCRTGISCR